MVDDIQTFESDCLCLPVLGEGERKFDKRLRLTWVLEDHMAALEDMEDDTAVEDDMESTSDQMAAAEDDMESTGEWPPHEFSDKQSKHMEALEFIKKMKRAARKLHGAEADRYSLKKLFSLKNLQLSPPRKRKHESQLLLRIVVAILVVAIVVAIMTVIVVAIVRIVMTVVIVAIVVAIVRAIVRFVVTVVVVAIVRTVVTIVVVAIVRTVVTVIVGINANRRVVRELLPQRSTVVALMRTIVVVIADKAAESTCSEGLKKKGNLRRMTSKGN
ncbi:hypothetical protein OROHE_014326 [Orobanche hederae]